MSNLSVWVKWAQIISVPVGIIAIIVNVLTWFWNPSNEEKTKIKRKIRSFSIISFIVAVGFFAGIMVPKYVFVRPTNSIKITYPSDGDKVPRNIEVMGEYAEIPSGEELWLYHHDPDHGLYYFDNVAIHRNGAWVVRDVIIGAEDEAETSFKIAIVSVNDRDADNLRRKRDELGQLPSSTKEYHWITVYRK